MFPGVPGVGAVPYGCGVKVDMGAGMCEVEVCYRYQAKRELTGKRVRGKVFNGN